MATIEELQAQMKANSAAWKTADSATQTALHDQNVALQKQIDQMQGTKSTYNPASGTWTTAPASSASTTTAQTAPSTVKNPSLSVYDQYNLSSADQQAILALKNQYAAQKAAGASDAVLQGINAQANAIRGGYGYSGGAAGNEYIKLAEEEKAAAPAPTYSAPILPSASSQESYVNSLYDAQIQKQLSDLKAAYEQNQVTLDAAAQKIPAQYQLARNEAAANYEQQRRNAAEYAAAAGLNSGASAQQQLAMGTQYQGDMTNIANQEHATLADLELQRTQLATAYNNAIAQAKSEGNYERAAALYQEAVRVDNSLVQTALNQANLDYQQYLAAYNSYRDSQNYAFNQAQFAYQQQQDELANQLALQKLQQAAKSAASVKTQPAANQNAAPASSWDDYVKSLSGIDKIVALTAASMPNTKSAVTYVLQKYNTNQGMSESAFRYIMSHLKGEWG